jgi:RNA polymerase sigma-70 factor (ECF subfamily)
MTLAQRDAGLRDQLEQTYMQHRQGLFSLAISITECREQAEDAIHSAFVRLCSLPSLPNGELASYVFASVRNAAIDTKRRNRTANHSRESLFNGSVPPPAGPGHPDAALLTAERDESLRIAIRNLEEDERVIVVLKTFASLSFESIGQVLDIPMKTAATRYRRALIKLQERLRGQL